MSIAKLKKLRESYSRLVIAKDAGVGIAAVDSALKSGEVKNETLAKWLAAGNHETKLEKLKTEITGKRGRGGAKKAAAPAKKKTAKKAGKPRAAKKKENGAAPTSEATAT